jgi:hypothetical protein
MTDAFVRVDDLNECQPNTERQKRQAQQVSDDDGGSHFVGFHLKFVSEQEIEDCGWQACKQNQSSALQPLQGNQPKGQKDSRDSEYQDQNT